MTSLAHEALSPFLSSKTRGKVLDILKQKNVVDGLIYLKGDVHQERHNTDVELLFRQESNFMYMSGVLAPGFSLIIDVKTRKSTLLAPVVSPEDVMWMGPGPTLDSLREKYDFDDVRYDVNLAAVLRDAKLSAQNVIVIPGEKGVTALGTNMTESQVLISAITEARVTKFDFELERLRLANKISSAAHLSLMKSVRPGQNEQESDALFAFECHRRGLRQQAYGSIVGSEQNAATLHYDKNNSPVKDGLMLVDAGAECECYAADITRTYPANGVFSTEARIIYEIVLGMQKAVFAAMKPGVEYEELHRLAQKICTQGLVTAGILKGDLNELLEAHTSAVFFPHGLGHSIGLDVHDVGGYPDGVKRIDEPGIRNLRMRRKLEEGMVVTVEPGCYFNETLIENALANPVVSKFIDTATLAKYRGIGGVRIEDCVLVTADGIENFTTVCKETEEVLRSMA